RLQVDHEKRFLLLLRQLHRQGGAAVGLALRQDQRPIRIADVPLGALRVAVPGRFSQGVVLWNGTVLRPPSPRTPAPAVDPQLQRHVERGTIDTRLPARDDSGKHEAIPSLTRCGERTMRILAALAVALLAPPAQAQKPDPSLVPIKDNPKLPRVLLIGDSISIGYTLPVRK